MSRRLATVPGVARADRFAAADVIVPVAAARARPRGSSPSTPRTWTTIASRTWSAATCAGARCSTSAGVDAGFAHARRVTVEVPGQGRPARVTLPAGGVVDVARRQVVVRDPGGDVQGDVAMVPRSIVVDYATFERALLPALRARVGRQTPVLNPDLADH